MRIVPVLAPGSSFNHWTIIGERFVDRNHMTLYLCRCVCGVEREIFRKHLVSGASKSCGCKEPRKQGKRNWTGFGEISGTYWNEIKKCASGDKSRWSRDPVPFAITIEQAWDLYIQQDRRCALSGIPIHFDYSTRRTASLDRVDSSKGYELGNIQWVHKDVNRMKNIYNQSYFIEMCRLIAARHPMPAPKEAA